MGSSPIFPSINQNCPYNYVSNHYNLITTKKQTNITIKCTKKTLSILNIFYRTGIVSNFILYKNMYTKNTNFFIKFSPIFYKNSNFFKKIKTISTPSKAFYIRINSLHLIQKVFKSSIVIISTSKGLLTLNEALSVGIGGKVVYIIN